jgi:hypothetical protein
MSQMTWSETRRRQQVLHEVHAIAGVRRDGVLPWSDDYADAYAGPDELVRDLAYFWRIQVEAQIDENLAEAELESRRADLYRRYADVLRILDAHRDAQLHQDHELAA